MQSNEEKHFVRKNKVFLLYCGVLSGLLQAAVFNPWDRALYLSVKHDRNFLHSKNFSSPFAGVFQTIGQRALSAGLYFPLEEIFSDLFTESFPHTHKYHIISSFMAGTLAGAVNGLLMNPFSSIKVS